MGILAAVLVVVAAFAGAIHMHMPHHGDHGGHGGHPHGPARFFKSMVSGEHPHEWDDERHERHWWPKPTMEPAQTSQIWTPTPLLSPAPTTVPETTAAPAITVAPETTAVASTEQPKQPETTLINTDVVVV
mmetsp:Transcript_13519/g.34004  ORF Transcript_13519/g.34004 Transcript_13519/m.34004 type:complete len:131 (-) Transcript_13519:145-537(-)